MQNTRQILTFILSAYLLALMIMHCSHAHMHAPADGHTYYSQAYDDHDAHLCSPFCACSSCVAAVVLQPTLQIDPAQAPAPWAGKISNFYHSAQSSYYGSIWQPPQLV